MKFAGEKTELAIPGVAKEMVKKWDSLLPLSHTYLEANDTT